MKKKQRISEEKPTAQEVVNRINDILTVPKPMNKREEQLAALREVRTEIARLNRAACQTVFNPAATNCVDGMIATLQAQERGLTLPAVHLGGTGLQTLMDGNMRIVEALRDALEAIQKAEFHPRDYHVLSDTAFNEAEQQRKQHVTALREAIVYFEKHVEHLFGFWKDKHDQQSP